MAAPSLRRLRPEPLDGDSLRVITRTLAAKLREDLHLSGSFIQSNVDDLVGQALLEYERKREAGEEIINPGGLIVHIGYCRAIDQLRREGREVHGEAAELILALTEDPGTGTDSAALSRIEAEQLHEAIGALPVIERQVLGAAYFQGDSALSAARALGMSETNFRRRRDKALRTLRRSFAIPEQIEPGGRYAFDIGAAAHLSLAVGASARLIRLHWLTDIFDRMRDFAARLFLGGGGEGVGGVAGGSAAKVLGIGICGASATAAACVVAGVSPGIGLVGLGDHHDLPPARVAAAKSPPPPSAPIAPTIPDPSVRVPAKSAPDGRPSHGHGRLHRQTRVDAAAPLGIESAAPEPEPAPTSSPVAEAGSSPTPDEVAAEQFGP